MAPEANLKSMYYNPFKMNDNFFNSENDPDINFYSDIFPLDTKFVKVLNVFVKAVSVLRANIRSMKIFLRHSKTSILNLIANLA